MPLLLRKVKLNSIIRIKILHFQLNNGRKSRMKKLQLILSLLFTSFTLLSCQIYLKSESGLYNVELKKNPKVLVDGCWSWGKGNPYAGEKSGKIYIHPLDVSKVRHNNPEAASLMVVQMQDYIVQAMVKELREMNAANHTNWTLTTNPSEADVCIHTAVVKFRPQQPALKVTTTITSTLGAVPGASKIFSFISEGNITLEGTMRDARSGQLLVAFKDTNRKSARLYTAEAYSKTGNADVNLKAWAEKLARLVRESAYDRMGNSTMQKKIRERSYFDVFSQSVADSF